MSGASRKLSSLDASFLYLETPEMPMHVGSIAIFRRSCGLRPLPRRCSANFSPEMRRASGLTSRPIVYRNGRLSYQDHIR